ncbi:PsiF family protein [Melaminivora alkalimesophila]|uniref:PsiF repeat-containing protein n=1 Tax=Melaminivora alkalimesophila TaxID=1165852 RepID=A0A317RBK5_9BURK|nr:PsiF family protein [Melaminivora alkalimesophila]PWW45556.1 psiF repeat-containing protein [Melaminivora alkalimesophila]
MPPKNLLAALALAALGLPALAAPPAYEAAPAPAPTAQQAKMKTCNARAKEGGLKGDERKAFMKNCLSASKQEKQQAKMKTCNADAGKQGLKGDERKAFMKECLSNKPAG